MAKGDHQVKDDEMLVSLLLYLEMLLPYGLFVVIYLYHSSTIHWSRWRRRSAVCHGSETSYYSKHRPVAVKSMDCRPLNHCRFWNPINVVSTRTAAPTHVDSSQWSEHSRAGGKYFNHLSSIFGMCHLESDETWRELNVLHVRNIQQHSPVWLHLLHEVNSHFISM